MVMLAGTKGVVAMAATGLPDDGDDIVIPRRRALPDFPWGELRRVLILSGSMHRSNTQIQPVPMTTHRHSDGIPYAALESAKHGPVLTAVARAFNESRARHNLTPAHWRVLLGCEAGLIERTIVGHPFTDKHGVTYQKRETRLCIYRPERPDAVVPYDDTDRVLGVREDLARRYHKEVRKAIEDEWNYLMAGWEK